MVNGLSPWLKWDCDKTIACQFRRRHSFWSGSSGWNPFTHMMYRLEFQLGVKHYGQAPVATISGPYQPWNMWVCLKMGEHTPQMAHLTGSDDCPWDFVVPMFRQSHLRFWVYGLGSTKKNTNCAAHVLYPSVSHIWAPLRIDLSPINHSYWMLHRSIFPQYSSNDLPWFIS